MALQLTKSLTVPSKVVQKVLTDLKKRNNFLLNMIIPALSKVKTWFGGTFFSADFTILTSVTLSILKN